MTLTPLVLLPGLLCDAALWRAQVEALKDVAAAAVADLTLDDSVAAMAARVLASAPPRFALAGLSMGGYVAFEIMRQAPERVTRLALFDTGAGPDSERRADQRRRLIATLEVGRFRGVTRHILPQLVHASHVEGPVGETVMAMARRVGADAYRRQQQAILSRPDSRPLLETINVPTLVAVGDDDRVTPPDTARDISRGIAGSELHVLRDCGHLPALERPDETSALLRGWLARQFR
ncbi:MAG: alpha/beta fold hydrolase [Sphingomonadales bacterium]